MGVAVHHGVDATKVGGGDARALLDPEGLGFDAVVWNHPHAGFPKERQGPGFEQSDVRAPTAAPLPAQALRWWGGRKGGWASTQTLNFKGRQGPRFEQSDLRSPHCPCTAPRG